MRDEVNGFPIQLAKVQRPALRAETLERPRLLDWLRAKIHGRVTLVLADAGYGKTTLLADFSRRHRVRTLWYRLDDDDRDWVSFLHHLVAAGREHDPTFAPRTASLLSEIGVAGPGRETVLDTFIAELPTIAVGGAVLVFDDFHLVDDATDVRHITRELLARGPERLTFVFASRRLPTIPLARFRTIGEVAELGTRDLRFDRDETARLFNESYGRRLEPDVLADLAVRTEGWVASLQMVQAALRDRSPAEIRRFVRGLTGADHELYEYLAEEVVGDLDEEVQRFLMETSLLQVVTPELAAVASRRDASDTARLLAIAERLTLLGRLSGAPRTHLRYHPLVREFLEGRLRATDGSDAVAARHRHIGDAAAASDWRTAAHHYREADDTAAVLDVIGAAIPTILGDGQYALAETFIRPIPAAERPRSFDLILSRVDMQQGDFDAAIAASEAVLEAETTDPVQRDHALLNLATLHLNLGNGAQSLLFARRLRSESSNPYLHLIADSAALVVESCNAGDLNELVRQLRVLAASHGKSNVHHYGVTMLNLAAIAGVQDDDDEAIRRAQMAIEALETTSGRLELSSAAMTKAAAQARQGDLDAALRIADEHVRDGGLDAAIETAQFVDSFGDPRAFLSYLDSSKSTATPTHSQARAKALILARHHLRHGRFQHARQLIDSIGVTVWSDTAFEAARLTTIAYLSVASGSPTILADVENARAHAEAQHAHAWRRVSELLVGLAGDTESLNDAVRRAGSRSPWHLTYVADALSPRLGDLGATEQEIVASSAQLHPVRWRHVLRRRMDDSQAEILEAELLERIGEREDVPRLRRFAKSSMRRLPGSAALGRGLSRRVADRIFVEDQGRVSIRVGSRSIPGSEVRRKVLALLCLLLTRPELSSTRDQVLDALWPELDPETAVNSLNQTLYFMRRVFEAEYAEDLSPGYVHHESELIWLDPELVSSRSAVCRQFLRGLASAPTPGQVDDLVEMYRGRFAMDFEYEDWSASHRDSLHAAYLEVVERSVRDDLSAGHHERGIRIAQRVLAVDPGADELEVVLLRLYQLTGAHSAAAEQYSHYATAMRNDLGIEAPPLEALQQIGKVPY